MQGGSAGGGDPVITAAGSVLGGALLLNWGARPMPRDGAMTKGPVGRRGAETAEHIVAPGVAAAAIYFVTNDHAGLCAVSIVQVAALYVGVAELPGEHRL